MELEQLKQEVAYFMRRLYERRLTTALGGNISFKASESLVLITPSGMDKARIQPDQVGQIRPSGDNLSPELRPSMETPIHLALYAHRPDIRAVVHAHPVTASSFAASDRKINCRLIAESRLFLKEVALAPYACMGTQALAQSVVEALGERGNAVLMVNHGALTVGKSLLEAYDRMEILESAARITLLTGLLGGERELTPCQLQQIDALMTSCR
jgi:L-fuculose-phosphate aldolase